MVLLIWLPKSGMPFILAILLLKDGKIRLDILDNTFVVGQRILVAFIKKEKERLTLLIDALDLKAETIPLSVAERVAKKEADECLANLRHEEESKWAQRGKVKHIQEGANNTKYFHLIANGKHRKKCIFQLEQDEGTIVGQQNLKTYITEFYKKLFGAPAPCFVSLREEVTQDIPQLSEVESNILTSPFTEEEVFEAISNMEHNKAPGPDGFPAEFCQVF
jgi:mannosylglycoprotein endo-beta-mannosidase